MDNVAKEIPQFCCTCNWWTLEKRICVKRSPTRDLEDTAHWPITSVLDRCGEWECALPEELIKRKLELKKSK